MNYFPRTFIKNYHKLSSFSQHKFIISLLLRPELWNQVGLCSPRRPYRKSPLLFPSFWCLPAILDIPWLIASSLKSLSIFTWPSLCLCVSFSVDYKDIPFGSRAYPNPIWSHLDPYPNYICKDLFPNKMIYWRSG